MGNVSPLFVLTFQGGIVVVAFAAMLLFGIKIDSGGMTTVAAVIWGTLGGVGTYIVLLALTRVDAFFPGQLQQHVSELRAFACSFSYPMIVALSALAGVGEELLFRGVIQGGLSGVLTQPVAILVAALLFGAVHYLSSIYFLIATLLGVVLGVAYAVSGSILVVMVWHGVYDLTAMVCLRRFPGLFDSR